MLHKDKGERSALAKMLSEMHERIENREQRRIVQKEMAKRLGLSLRAYSEYIRGNAEPLALIAAFRFLAMLSDQDALEILERWRQDVAPHLPNSLASIDNMPTDESSDED